MAAVDAPEFHRAAPETKTEPAPQQTVPSRETWKAVGQYIATATYATLSQQRLNAALKDWQAGQIDLDIPTCRTMRQDLLSAQEWLTKAIDAIDRALVRHEEIAALRQGYPDGCLCEGYGCPDCR